MIEPDGKCRKYLDFSHLLLAYERFCKDENVDHIVHN
jgi:hypothetical protein